MKIKNIAVMVLLVSAMLFCSACGNSADDKESVPISGTEPSSAEKDTEPTETSDSEEVTEGENLYGEKMLDEIREDLEKSDLIPMEFGTDDDIRIENLELIKRNTTESTDDVYCTLTVNSSSISMKQDYKLTYNHYTIGGWILDEYTATSEQTYLPLEGVDEFKVDGDLSEMFGSEFEYEVTGRDTDLDSLRDKIYLSVDISRTLFQASGSMTLDYFYENGNWVLLDCEKSSDYSENWDIDGSWGCRYGKSVFYLLQIWHNEDGTISGNKTAYFLDGNSKIYGGNRYFENEGLWLNLAEGLLGNADSENHSIGLGYDNFYEVDWENPEDDSHVYKRLTMEIIERIENEEEIESYIPLEY